MSHQWYVKRGDKKYGPFTSAQLKQLAGEGKVSPTTEVRLGDDGAWTQAARVKGLFGSAQTPPGGNASAASTPSAPALSAASPPIPPPVAKVASAQIPPTAKPLAARPMTAVPSAGLPTAQTPPASNPPIAGKLIGAVGATFGVLALATCWLSLIEPMFGWIGIIVGALGLLVGIAGLVVAALQNASGLVPNVAAASSALVGLVVSVVLGIQSGMFARPAPPAITPAPIIVQSPPPPTPKVEEPKPEPEPPPPEPVWTDASQPLEQGPIRAKITSAAVEQIRLESGNPLSMKREKPAPFLHVRVLLENISTDKIVDAPGWMGAGGSGALGAVGQALGDSTLGKQLAGAAAAATLVDDTLNPYPQIEAIRLPTSQAELGGNSNLRPGESSEKHLLFDRPLDGAQHLRIELAPGGFGGSEPLRFEIPRSMWTGETPAASPEIQ